MPFKYDKFFALLKEKGYSTYKLRKEKIIGEATIQKLRSGAGNIDTRTLERICELLKCQPGDIMEYIEDDTANSIEN